MSQTAQEVIPSARRLIKSLRDIGYEFPAAVADLVDNSIEAGASRVDIRVEFDGDKSYVQVSDDGKGMTGEELKEAMRYGSERSYHEEDLGKFGLGLKTASMSQCQRFSVASRTSKTTNNTVSACWDLDHVEKVNKWEIIPPKKEIQKFLLDPLTEHTGTVVIWEKLDRILGYKHPYGEQARKKLNSMCRELEEHLSMVFHKFLEPESKRHLSVYLNWNKIEPWDPFARDEPETRALSSMSIKLNHEGVKGKIALQPYILPPKESFSSQNAFKRLSGPASWNQQQGFYIYRAGRMIQSGGWCGLRTRDEHTKLSRIELNFSPEFDNAFKINVAKMRVQLPIQIRDEIDRAISPAIKLAREYYDGKKKQTFKPAATVRSAVQERVGQPENSRVAAANIGGISAAHATDSRNQNSEMLFTIDEIEKKATSIASQKEQYVISQVFKRLRKLISRQGPK